MALDTSWATALTKSIEAQRDAVLIKASGCRVVKASSNGHGPRKLNKALARGAQRRRDIQRPRSGL